MQSLPELDSLTAAEAAKLVAFHNHRYWDLNDPEISDYDFDRLVNRLRALEPTHPVLASMGAKYTRELFMRRLNAWFAERMPGIEPTAGYVEDGRRFLTEVKPILVREAIPESEFTRVV